MMQNFAVGDYLKQRDDLGNIEGPKFFEKPWYLKHIPFATIAICPYCHVEFKARFDFNSLAFWNCRRKSKSSAFAGVKTRQNHQLDGPLHSCCKHLFLYDTIMNFRVKDPETDFVGGIHIGGSEEFATEVPGVMPCYMNAKKGLFTLEDVSTEKPSPIFTRNLENLNYAYYHKKVESSEKIEIKAVISTFPVSQVRNKEFVECCDSYFISYFVPEPNDCLEEGYLYKWNNPHAVYHVLNVVADYYDSTRTSAHLHELDYDLKPYVERGDLLWYTEGKLHGPEEKQNFPFYYIKGRTSPFTAKFKRWDEVKPN